MTRDGAARSAAEGRAVGAVCLGTVKLFLGLIYIMKLFSITFTTIMVMLLIGTMAAIGCAFLQVHLEKRKQEGENNQPNIEDLEAKTAVEPSHAALADTLKCQTDLETRPYSAYQETTAGTIVDGQTRGTIPMQV